jgi:hypothetical protein
VNARDRLIEIKKNHDRWLRTEKLLGRYEAQDLKEKGDEILAAAILKEFIEGKVLNADSTNGDTLLEHNSTEYIPLKDAWKYCEIEGYSFKHGGDILKIKLKPEYEGQK